MRRVRWTLDIALTFAAAAVAACATPASRLCPVPPGNPAESVLVVSHGWHAGLVLPARAAAAGGWPAPAARELAEHVEVGWGERDFYMASNPGWWSAVEAAIVPNESVLHVVWFDAPAEAFFPDREILDVRLSAAGMERLSRYVANSFARSEHGSAIDLGAGLYGNSQFYLSRERYDLLNTCNVWVARALRDAGCPISPTLALTVNALMRRVRPFATQVQAADGR